MVKYALQWHDFKYHDFAMGDSRKYPYLYHGWLFGFLEGSLVQGVLRLWNSEGMGRYLRLEIHGGISYVGFLE